MDIAGGRFVVTGGASLIGSHLTQQLLEAGAAAVILFDNYALGSPEVAASLAQDRRVTAVRGDITRLPELLNALDQVDGVSCSRPRWPPMATPRLTRLTK